MFIENVLIKQGSINVRADKVIVIRRQNGNNKRMIIEAHGTPTTFYQLQDDGKEIKGHSDKIYYEIKNGLIILTGNVCLEQLKSNIRADKISYLISTQYVEAFSDKNKWVTTTFLISSLNYKKT